MGAIASVAIGSQAVVEGTAASSLETARVSQSGHRRVGGLTLWKRLEQALQDAPKQELCHSRLSHFEEPSAVP